MKKVLLASLIMAGCCLPAYAKYSEKYGNFYTPGEIDLCMVATSARTNPLMGWRMGAMLDGWYADKQMKYPFGSKELQQAYNAYQAQKKVIITRCPENL